MTYLVEYDNFPSTASLALVSWQRHRPIGHRCGIVMIAPVFPASGLRWDTIITASACPIFPIKYPPPGPSSCLRVGPDDIRRSDRSRN